MKDQLKAAGVPLTPAIRGSLGFQALADKHFNGDRKAAAKFVADVGRASYFRSMRPTKSKELMESYKDKFPHLYDNPPGEVAF